MRALAGYLLLLMAIGSVGFWPETSANKRAPGHKDCPSCSECKPTNDKCCCLHTDRCTCPKDNPTCGN